MVRREVLGHLMSSNFEQADFLHLLPGAATSGNMSPHKPPMDKTMGCTCTQRLGIPRAPWPRSIWANCGIASPHTHRSIPYQSSSPRFGSRPSTNATSRSRQSWTRNPALSIPSSWQATAPAYLRAKSRSVFFSSSLNSLFSMASILCQIADSRISGCRG